jgi:hypothetical protein
VVRTFQMRSLRSFEVEPWLKSAGQQVWTRIRRGLLTHEQELQESLQREVEQLSGARTNVQRATQLAKVLDAVFAIADAHELTEAQVSALREVRPASRAVPVVELARKLESRALQVIDQMLGGDARVETGLRGDGLEAFLGWLTPRVISDARGPSGSPSASPSPSTYTSTPTPTVSDAPAVVVRPPLAAGSSVGSGWLRSDLSADLSFARAGMDAARASLQFSQNELSVRLRVTHQAALDAAQWISRKRRNELAMWLLSKSAQFVLRKWIIPQLSRVDVGPQFLLRVAVASGAVGSAPLARLSSPVTRAAARVRRASRAVKPVKPQSKR